MEETGHTRGCPLGTSAAPAQAGHEKLHGWTNSFQLLWCLKPFFRRLAFVPEVAHSGLCPHLWCTWVVAALWVRSGRSATIELNGPAVKQNADGYFFAGNPQYCTITGFNWASNHRNVCFRSYILGSVLQNLFKFIVYFKKFMRVIFRAVDVKPLMKRQPALKPAAPIGNACQIVPWRSVRVRRWQVQFVLCVPRESRETRSANARDADLSKECSYIQED